MDTVPQPHVRRGAAPFQPGAAPRQGDRSEGSVGQCLMMAPVMR
ncbi:hypothetical protein HMPREF1318_0977 [Actinomyces massiliensis F0489]|uniref:Uncharacterized protein n=1 Tax=Actinomyces massiliensis F0489 TaxID=1125718 RepID=J1HK97_9ACTO|nr:hypothetical protein HMPREF1318_0977 [Actinomyces massiliensis F0489]